MSLTPRRSQSRGFQALATADQWNDLIRSGRRKAVAGGTRILDQGDRSPVVHALEHGRVRVVHTEPDGNEALIAVRGPGDLLGEYAQSDQGEHMASVWTLEDCTVVTLDFDAFGALVRRHRLEGALQQYILGKIRQSGRRIWRASNLQTEQRVALLFMEIVGAAPTIGEPTVPMTQAQVAASLGVALSSVTRVLAHWREVEVIRTVPAPLQVLDMAALARHANTR